MPASLRTASTARANSPIENCPSLGDSLLPCPGRSKVMTRYRSLIAGTWYCQDVESQVQPWTKITASGPFPAEVQWMSMPSTEADHTGAELTRAINAVAMSSDVRMSNLLAPSRSPELGSSGYLLPVL